MFDLGVPELLIILVIVVLLFGVGRIGKIAGELGRGVREFREGLSSKDETPASTETTVSKDEPAPSSSKS